MTAARDKVLHEVGEVLMSIYCETGRNPQWGQRRLAGCAGRFGLPDDYALAAVLVDIAIINRGPLSHLEQRAVDWRIAEAAGCPVPESHYNLPDAALAELVRASAADPVAWAACSRIAEDAIGRGEPVPERLRDWVLAAIKGTAPKPDKRNKSGTLAARDDAIRFAVKLAMESGAFQAATHRPYSHAPGTELLGGRARSACELVAHRFGQAGIGIALSYEQVARIWGNRDRSHDPVGMEKK